jgi:hypothetical protein
MFPASPVEAEPDFFDRGVCSEIVDMPVGPARRLQMMSKAARNAAGSERTSEVNIEARLHV